MRLVTAVLFAVILSVGAMAPLSAAYAQLDIVVRVDIEPPPLPVYDQPPIPTPGYLWVPGYWAWDDDTGYYWVPGTWVSPPEPELLWTPGYWGWSDGVYVFHDGYWGPKRTTATSTKSRSGRGMERRSIACSTPATVTVGPAKSSPELSSIGRA